MILGGGRGRSCQRARLDRETGRDAGDAVRAAAGAGVRARGVWERGVRCEWGRRAVCDAWAERGVRRRAGGSGPSGALALSAWRETGRALGSRGWKRARERGGSWAAGEGIRGLRAGLVWVLGCYGFGFSFSNSNSISYFYFKLKLKPNEFKFEFEFTLALKEIKQCSSMMQQRN